MKFVARRAGLSLVEKLIAIAIIGVLVGLVLPGVQKARDAASRISCANHLRQIGLGLHQYHDARNALPAGVYCPFPDPSFPEIDRVLPWHVSVLPYIEQNDVWTQTWQAWLGDHLAMSSPPHIHESTIIKLYLCPSESNSEYVLSNGLRLALTSYMGVSGETSRSRNGLLFFDSAVSLPTITDGTSQTLLVGERPPNMLQAYGRWYGGNGQPQDGVATSFLGVREFVDADEFGCARRKYSFGAGRADKPCDAYHFWSLHTGGANFCYADGSVHFLSYSVDEIMPALATRAGGEVVEVP